MTDLERIIKFIEWLIYDKIANNRKDLAEKLGYTESSLSQIINGKVALSDKFIKKLSKIDNRVNIDWLLTGEGQMLKSNSITPNKIEMESQTLINELRDRVLSLEKQLDEKQKFCQFLMKQNEDLQQLVTASPEIKKKEAS